MLVLANISPPAGPAAPGAFDFQRVAWYQQFGAVGYALAPAAVTEHGRPNGIVRTIDGLRADITARIPKALPKPRRRRGSGPPDWRADSGDEGRHPVDARFRPGAYPLDLGPAHCLRGRAGDGLLPLRHCLDPGAGAQGRCQEDRRRNRASGRAVLHRARGCAGAGTAFLRDGGVCAPRHPARPRGTFASPGGMVGGRRAGRRARGSGRRLVPDVVCRGHCPDRRLGDGQRLAPPPARARRAVAASPVVARDDGDWREPGHQPDCIGRNRGLCGLSLQSHIPARHRGQHAGRAPDRLLDHAVRPASHAPNAVRSGEAGAGSDGVGRDSPRRDRSLRRVVAADSCPRPVDARRKPLAADDRRFVALLLASALALRGPAGGDRRVCCSGQGRRPTC